MKKQIRFFGVFLLAAAISFIIIINWRLYYSPTLEISESDTINLDKLAQLRYLKEALNNGADVGLQSIYPEGFVFFNALYGLSWIELSEKLKPSHPVRNEALNEAQLAFDNINSEQGRIIFDKSLPLSYGAYYNGWMTYLLGKKIGLAIPAKRNAQEVQLFKRQCSKIAEAIRKQTYPESYYGNTWPADVVVCLAGLAVHDKIFEPVYQHLISDWWRRVNQNLDEHGLIPHSVRSDTGRPLQAARGSSQSLIQSFLPEIISANTNFETYKELFVDERFGLPGIREYPKGTDGYGDIDSGPMVMDIGAAATIVGIRSAQLHEDFSTSAALRNGVEAFAFPFQANEKKRYLLGRFPMADAFICWADGPFITHYSQDNWMLTFQLWSAGFIIALILMIVWTQKLTK